MSEGRKSISNKYNIPYTYSIGNRKVDVGIVNHVILNEDDENIPNDPNNGQNKLTNAYIGRARIRKLNDVSSSNNNSITYLPLIPDEGIPLVGETVELIELAGIKYYKRIPSPNLNVGNALNNADKKVLPPSNSNETNVGEYSDVSQTSTPISTNSESDIKIGKYFTTSNIHKLRLYEGDKIIESRFGQSIRFSGYNNSDNSFSPTIIIRNRENDESINNLNYTDITEEDVNRDGSTIAITSGEYKLNFQPGTVDDGGGTNFKTTPRYFDLPQEYTGTDQVLVNTGRLILSSRDSEMIHFSKGNYGFISDGKFIIDNGQDGADLDFNGEVRITTNDNSFYIIGDAGNIYLNTENTNEPLVRGNTLKALLEELIDAIGQQQYATPSGPTSVGPTNVTTFRRIKSRLRNILSNQNYTE